MNRVVFSSKDLSWCTPQKFFDELNKEFKFTLDAAATSESAKCEKYYTPEDDALSQPWDATEGAVFCNPPYGRQIGKWVEKAFIESLKGTTIVLLVPSRTCTRWFHNHVLDHAEIRFIRSRLRFADAKGNTQKNSAPFPSMVVVYNGPPRKMCVVSRIYNAANYNPKKKKGG